MKEWRACPNEEMTPQMRWRKKGEEMKAIPYFTSYEEEIVLFHEGTLTEGDIRAWLKKHEVDKALRNWKALKVSGQLIRRFPKQLPF